MNENTPVESKLFVLDSCVFGLMLSGDVVNCELRVTSCELRVELLNNELRVNHL